MADHPLDDFFAEYHRRCRGSDALQNALVLYASGPRRGALRAAAMTWEPASRGYQAFKQIMLQGSGEPPRRAPLRAPEARAQRADESAIGQQPCLALDQSLVRLSPADRRRTKQIWSRLEAHLEHWEAAECARAQGQAASRDSGAQEPLLSLDAFFAAHRDCDRYALQKAVMRCAYGSERDLLRKAAYAWSPGDYFHQSLRNYIFAGDPPRLPRGYITPDVTRVRKKLETWLRYYWTPRQSAKQAEPPEEIDTTGMTLRQLFNSETYSYADIENAVWLVSKNPAAGLRLMTFVKPHWRSDRLSAREKRLMPIVMASVPGKRPRPGNPYVYRPLIGKIKAIMRRTSSFG